MGRAPQNSKLAEIFVDCYQSPAFTVSCGQNRLVPRIFFPISGPDDIVSDRLQLGFGLGRDARIQKNSHELTSIERGSIRSLAVILLA